MPHVVTGAKQMPTKRGRSNSSSHSKIVYVVLQRSSVYGRHNDEHDVSCVSIHTTLATANQAAKWFFDIDEDEEVETEDGWLSWEDLYGTRVQTDSEGKVRVIRVLDTREEDLVWVEKNTIDEESGTEQSENDDEDDVPERRVNSNKRVKVIYICWLLLCHTFADGSRP